jgi:cytochrome c-type biogenesis protein CcmE
VAIDDSALTDTEPVPPAPPVRTGNRTRLVIAAAVVLAALGFLVVRGLGNATVYFRTADEAVAQKASLGDKRFRIEGTVVDGSVRPAGKDVTFTIQSKGESVHVRHTGDPPELFRAGIPVVLEGRWQGDVYASDRIMVKHSETYKANHPERTKDYRKAG